MARTRRTVKRQSRFKRKIQRHPGFKGEEWILTRYNTFSSVRNLIGKLHLRSQWNHRIGWLYCSWQWRFQRNTFEDPESTPEEKWHLSTHLHQGEVSVQQIAGLASEAPPLSLWGDIDSTFFNKSPCVTTWSTSGPKHLWTQSAGVHCFSTHEILLYTSYLTSLFSFLSDVMLTEWPHELCERLNRKMYTNEKCQAY